MSYSAPNRLLLPHRHSIDSFSATQNSTTSSWTAAAWPSANLAIYLPVVVPMRVVVKKLWFGSGGTGTGNYDLGLYDAAGTRLLASGSTTKPASATESVWDCTDTTIGPGVYFLALASDSGTDTFNRTSLAAPIPAALGVLTEASALPLPATATWTVPQTLAFVPLIGMLFSTAVS